MKSWGFIFTMPNIRINKACKQGEVVDVIPNKVDAMCRNTIDQK